MKRKLLLSFSAIAMAAILMSAITNAAHSPGAKTGSPADGANCTACHAGTTQTATNWITSNIPASGYVPGQNYTITLTGTHTGVVKFGFEITAEDAQKAKKGTFTITNTTETGLTNMMHAVTHTGLGLTPTNNSKTWSFDWVAPTAGSGDITFYAAINAANGNNSSSGDVIYNTNSSFSEDLSIGISETEVQNDMSIFPNPAQNTLNIELVLANTYDLQIRDLSGKLMISKNIKSQTTTYKLDIHELSKGVYFIQLKSESGVITKQFIKQ